ncbi:MAG: fibronectin type III domain-containing protein [archaeon]
MNSKIITILLILTLIIGGVFAITPSIVINNNAEYTTSTNVIANVTGLGVDTNYCINNLDLNTGCSWTNTTNSDLNINTTIPSIDGTQKVGLHLAVNGTYSDFNDTIILDTTAPVINLTTTTSPISGNYYDTNSIENIIISTSATDLNYLWYTIDTNTTLYSTLTIINLGTKIFSNGTYTITFDGNDHRGLSNDENSITFIVDTITPVITIVPNINWTNNITPAITINKTESNPNKLYFSCSNDFSGVTGIDLNETSIYNLNITTGKACTATDGNKPFFVKISDKLDRNSTVIESYVLLDTTKPTNPANLTAVATNESGKVKLKWDAPIADCSGSTLCSGNKEYKIYYQKGSDAWQNITPGGTAIEYTFTGLTNGTQYSFKVTMLDNAGNESTESNTYNATPQETTCSCNLKINNSTETLYTKNNAELQIQCDFDEDVTNPEIKYKYERESLYSLYKRTGTYASVDEYFTINSADFDNSDYLMIYCYGNGESITERKVYIDNELPEITWGSFDNNFAGTKEVSVDVTDNKNVNLVEFEINNVKHGTSKNGNKYYFNLKTTEYTNGNYTLKATAQDKAGNIKTISKTITISNILSADQTALKAITDAKAAKLEVEDLIKYFNDKGIAFNQDLLQEKEQTDALLLEAENQTSTTIKTTKANEANTTYKSILNKANISDTKQEAKYEFSVETLTDKLYALGLTQEQVERASALMLSSNVERKLSIIKVGDQYNAQIEITLTIDGNEETYKIVEVIPKEFIKSAAMIYSNLDFTIIEDDPVIEFSVPRGTSKIYYSVSVDENTANALIDSNVITNFASPPIIISSNETLTLSNNNGLGTILGIILTIILVLIIAGVIGVIYIGYNTNKTTGFNHNKQVNPVDVLKDKLKINKQNSGKEKWKYKNK